MRIRECAALVLACFTLPHLASAQPTPASTELASGYTRWKNGPPSDESYFPIGVWLQSPRNAARFKAAGINLYIGLWEGPTSAQLAELKQAGMPVMCDQNRVGLDNRDNPVIVGWIHGDEPDNAQGIPGLRRYGPPIPPEQVTRGYERMRQADPSRPVLLNLGQGVAWDDYIGRGVRRNHPEDYPEYLKGCDIASFDIYPVVHESRDVAGKLEFVARGVDRLSQWARGERIVWNCIECTHISNPKKKATPEQVRSEVWMSLIHGSRGIIYFVHQFAPSSKEAALLDDPEMLSAVARINQQIHELAPVLNSPSLPGRVTIKVANGPTAPPAQRLAPAADAPSPLGSIACLPKRRGRAAYLFAVNMRDQPARASFAIADMARAVEAEVLEESRRIPVQKGEFADDFKPYEVHLYCVQNPL